MIAFAPAKINLGLQVLRKREDNYHDIETIMMPIAWNDVIEVLPANDFTRVIMHQSAEEIPLEKNLVFKAWKLLDEQFAIGPVLIHVVKAIPSGAGLGGGSSDAATTLLLLNKIFKLQLSQEQLLTLALELGSDCPFFIHPVTSLAGGRGEIMKPAAIDLSGLFLVLAKPRRMSDGRQGISTAEAYAQILPDDSRKSLKEIVLQPIEQWHGELKNDFQPVMEKRFPEITELLSSLKNAGALYTAMSGSGSACFGIFKTKNPGIQFDGRDFQVFTTLL